MSNLVEEKYRIASLILVVSKLTVMDLLQKLELDRVPDAVYTVLGELLEKELLEVSQQTRLIFTALVRNIEPSHQRLSGVGILGKETDPRRDRGFPRPSDPSPHEKPLSAPTNHPLAGSKDPLSLPPPKYLPPRAHQRGLCNRP